MEWCQDPFPDAWRADAFLALPRSPFHTPMDQAVLKKQNLSASPTKEDAVRPKQTPRQIAPRLNDIGSHQTYNDLEGLARVVANRMLKGQRQLPPLPSGYKDWASVVSDRFEGDWAKNQGRHGFHEHSRC
jgi:hypothetical protein